MGDPALRTAPANGEAQVERTARKRLLFTGAVAVGIATLTACAPKPAPAPTAPPVVRIPPRPVPPMGAAPNLTIPPLGIDGVRQTVNTGLTSTEAVWNLRSAYNVAALNCQNAQHAPILAGYSDFLNNHKRTLRSANKDLDKKYRADNGSSYIRARESYQTQVYNYFALPPVMPAFCDAAVVLAQDLQAVPPGELETFAPGLLGKIEAVYHDFFNGYDQYRADKVAWEAHYAGGPPASMMGPTNSSMSQ